MWWRAVGPPLPLPACVCRRDLGFPPPTSMGLCGALGLRGDRYHMGWEDPCARPGPIPYGLRGGKGRLEFTSVVVPMHAVFAEPANDRLLIEASWKSCVRGHPVRAGQQ